MSLNQTLRQLKETSRSRVPPQAAAIMTRAAEDLEKSGILKMALGAGSRAPAFELLDCHNNSHKSEELLRQGPLILNFYRGAW